MRPAPPTPRSFPSNSVVEGTLAAITSTTRLVFSSITEVSTAWPHIRMLTYRIISRISARIVAAPWSSRSPCSESRIVFMSSSRVRSLTLPGSRPAPARRWLTSTALTVRSIVLRSMRLVTLRP